MAKKIKIPPISPERKALFDAAGADESTAQNIHRQLYENDISVIKKYAEKIGVLFVDLEVTGNEIIKRHINNLADEREHCASLAFAREKWFDYFQCVFGASLSKYWEGNRFGLDVCRLDEEVIKPPDGTSTYDFVREKHGEQAVQMLKELIHGIPDRQPRIEVPVER